MSIHYSVWEWEKSQNLSHGLGFEKSSVLEYDKVTLISIPIDINWLTLVDLTIPVLVSFCEIRSNYIDYVVGFW